MHARQRLALMQCCMLSGSDVGHPLSRKCCCCGCGKAAHLALEALEQQTLTVCFCHRRRDIVPLQSCSPMLTLQQYALPT